MLKSYLEKFGTKSGNKQKPLVCYEQKIDDANAKGNEALTQSLRQQKETNQDTIAKEKAEAEKELQSKLNRSVKLGVDEFMKNIYDFIEKHEERKNKKSDMESSSSTWDFARFRKYIPNFKTVFKKPLYQRLPKAEDVLEPMFNAIQERYLELGAVFLGVPVPRAIRREQKVAFLQDLQNYEYREATTRVFVDALIIPLLQRHGMQVRLEEKLYKIRAWNPRVPNSIADYVIYSGTGEILGAIETKTGGALIQQSVIQCMLQLLALRRKAPNPLFGVITDAVRYVFITLRDDGTFQFEWDPERPQCVSYYVTTWKDLLNIFLEFDLLLHRSKQWLLKEQDIDTTGEGGPSETPRAEGAGPTAPKRRKSMDNKATSAKQIKRSRPTDHTT